MKVTMTTSNANVRPKVLYREALTEAQERIELTVFQRSPGAWELLSNAPIDAVIEIDGYFGEIKNPAYPRNYIVNAAVNAEQVWNELEPASPASASTLQEPASTLKVAAAPIAEAVAVMLTPSFDKQALADMVHSIYNEYTGLDAKTVQHGLQKLRNAVLEALK